MSWVGFALSATALVGLGGILEKQLVSKYLPSSRTFLGWLGLSMLPHAAVFAVLFPVPEDTPIRSVLMTLGAGFLWGVSANMMYRALRYSEASRVYPIINVAPVFVAIMAVLFLGDRLGAAQWVGILVAVAGTVLVSLHTDIKGRGITLDAAFWTLVASSVFIAGGQIFLKVGLDHVPSLTGFWLMRLGMFVPLVLINWRPQVFAEMRASVRSPTTVGLLIVAEVIVFPAAILLFTRATSIGPVALVATMFGTVPVWIFALSTALSTPRWNLLNEPLRRETLILKAVAIALIVGGIGGITLL